MDARPSNVHIKGCDSNIEDGSLLLKGGALRTDFYDMVARSSPAEGAGVRITSGEGVTTTGVPVGATVVQTPRTRKQQESRDEPKRGRADSEKMAPREKKEAQNHRLKHEHGLPNWQCSRDISFAQPPTKHSTVRAPNIHHLLRVPVSEQRAPP